MEEKEIKFIVKHYTGLEQLEEEDRALIEKARAAATRAYSPYSRFSVGTAVLLENNEIITGNNQENSSFPAGFCAEQVALTSANARWPEVAVKTVAITAHTATGGLVDIIRPCGLCRQVMSEVEKRFRKPVKVIMDGHAGIEVVDQAGFLLPLSFDLDDHILNK